MITVVHRYRNRSTDRRRPSLLRKTFLFSLLPLAFLNVGSTLAGEQTGRAIAERPSITSAAASGTSIRSMSNKVRMLETVNDGDVLLVHVWTGLYETRGSSDPNIPNIDPACSNDDAVAIRLDASMPPDSTELDLLEQLIETARAGPFRIRFTIVQDECAQVGGGVETYPVAIGARILQDKPGPDKGPE